MDYDNDGYEDDKENQGSVSDTNPASKMRQREAGGDGGESTYLGMLSHGIEIKEGYVEQDIIGETKDWTLDKRTDLCGQEDTETDRKPARHSYTHPQDSATPARGGGEQEHHQRGRRRGDRIPENAFTGLMIHGVEEVVETRRV